MTDPSRKDHPTRSGARWCEQHQRWECTRQRKAGRGICHQRAITGLDACRMHAGTTGAVARAKGEALTAWSAVATVDGHDVELVDPARAVLGMLHMSWLRVHLLAGLVEEQVGREGLAQPAGAGSLAVGGVASEGGVSGLIGHTFAADKQAGVFASGEAVRALVTVEAAERDRCVRFAKVAHDMGIADREIQLAERQARAVAVALGATLDLLAIDAGRREEAQRVFMDRLREVVDATVE